MFDHLSLGISNLAQSIRFYDSAPKPLGVNQMFVMSDRGMAAYSSIGGITFWLYEKNSYVGDPDGYKLEAVCHQ